MSVDKVSVAWIDDDKSRKQDADALEKLNKQIHVNFFTPMEFSKAICDKSIAGKPIDIFLVDYDLSREKCGEAPYLGTGLSLIGLIRENFPDKPVYLYSGDTNSPIFQQLNYAAKQEANAVIPLKGIQDKADQWLPLDVADYKKITAAKTIDELLGTLKTPTAEIEKIKYVLPPDFKTEKLDPAKALGFSTWVRAVFLPTPGFLYNKLYAATLLGMTEEAFEKRKSQFKGALYCGIFSRVAEELWWKSLLADLVYKRLKPDDSSTDLKEISKTEFTLLPDEISKCSVCGELKPDIVALNPASQKKGPVHLRCSKNDTNATRMLYFDETRLMDGQ